VRRSRDFLVSSVVGFLGFCVAVVVLFDCLLLLDWCIHCFFVCFVWFFIFSLFAPTNHSLCHALTAVVQGVVGQVVMESIAAWELDS
jgi:hypothetical protein